MSFSFGGGAAEDGGKYNFVGTPSSVTTPASGNVFVFGEPAVPGLEAAAASCPWEIGAATRGQTARLTSSTDSAVAASSNRASWIIEKKAENQNIVFTFNNQSKNNMEESNVLNVEEIIEKIEVTKRANKVVEMKINKCKDDLKSIDDQMNQFEDEQRTCEMAVDKNKIEVGGFDKKIKEVDIELEGLRRKKNELINSRLECLEKGKELKAKQDKLKQNSLFSIQLLEFKKSKILKDEKDLTATLQRNIEALEKMCKIPSHIVSHGNQNGMLEFLEKTMHEKMQVIQEKEKDLECPVCLETAAKPIFMCPEMHLICSNCEPRMKTNSWSEVRKCPQCRAVYRGPSRRHRFAEKTAEEVERLLKELMELKEKIEAAKKSCLA